MFGLVILSGLGLTLTGVVLFFMPKRITRFRSALITFLGLMVFFAGGAMMPDSVRQELGAKEREAAAKHPAEQRESADHQRQQMEALRKAIVAALDEAGLPTAQSIEITDSNRLVATFLVDDAALETMARAGIRTPREFATKAVIAVRNAALPFKMVEDYRVTMNGPPPGPGLVMRYGSARFSEGSSVKWEPGTGR